MLGPPVGVTTAAALFDGEGGGLVVEGEAA